MSVNLPKVKNKEPNQVQITAEQLLREALANQIDDMLPPRVQINDDEELEDYMHRKRAEFENVIRKRRFQINSWIKYALFEENLRQLPRARSIFERALEVDYKNSSIWLKYAEMEMRSKNVNNARNVWERATKLLPRVDQLWYKYALMEEMLGNYNGTRQIFEKWMKILPGPKAWVIYSKFEERVGNFDLSREIMYRLIQAHPEVQSFIKVANFEEKRKDRRAARRVFEKAVEELGSFCLNEEFFLAFTDFEIRCHEYDRARVLFKHGVEKLQKHEAPRLYQSYVNFEKQYGSKGSIELVVVNKRRAQYEKILSEDPMRYDTWFDYISLEESEGIYDRIKDTYERAVANIPPTTDKKYWRRYQYFWLNYALFEESSGNPAHCRSIYTKALELIPHQNFSFSKLWINYALFEVRQLDLDKARKILGTAIGKTASSKVFSAYIDLEMQLGEIDRCRRLYDKWLLTHPWSCEAWLGFIELEKELEEYARCEALYELAVDSQEIDRPEIIWKSFIDFFIELDKLDEAREVYLRLLKKTKHLKVWLSLAKFEISLGNKEEARKVLKSAEGYFKNSQGKAERAELLQNWIEIEEALGDEGVAEELRKRLPRKVKKRRKVAEVDEAGFEEFVDFVFPSDEEDDGKSLKILQMAQKWKMEQR